MKTLPLFLLLTAAAFGQINVTPTAKSCKPEAARYAEVIRHLDKLPKHWNVEVVCTENEYQWARRKYNANSDEAFSIVTNDISFFNSIRPRLANDPAYLRFALKHEAEHVRCRCDLGEKHGGD
jgi:hypothetical protein